MSDQQLREEYGEPTLEPIIRADGKSLPPGVPSHAVQPIWMGDLCENITLTETGLILSDFGTAFDPSRESRYESYTPWVTRPPEAYFEPQQPLSYPYDVWSAAFAMWSIVGLRTLHDSFLFGEDEMIADRVDALGPLPREWWKKWDARLEKFTENGKPKEGRFVWTWEERFERSVQEHRREKGLEVMSDQERMAWCEMIRGMLRYRPGERWTIQQVLRSSWMQGWGLPTLEAGRC
jgi:serine/threonine-protein kinase SRPK3